MLTLMLLCTYLQIADTLYWLRHQTHSVESILLKHGLSEYLRHFLLIIMINACNQRIAFHLWFVLKVHLDTGSSRHWRSDLVHIDFTFRFLFRIICGSSSLFFLTICLRPIRGQIFLIRRLINYLQVVIILLLLFLLIHMVLKSSSWLL